MVWLSHAQRLVLSLLSCRDGPDIRPFLYHIQCSTENQVSGWIFVQISGTRSNIWHDIWPDIKFSIGLFRISGVSLAPEPTEPTPSKPWLVAASRDWSCLGFLYLLTISSSVEEPEPSYCGLTEPTPPKPWVVAEIGYVLVYCNFSPRAVVLRSRSLLLWTAGADSS